MGICSGHFRLQQDRKREREAEFGTQRIVGCRISTSSWSRTSHVGDWRKWCEKTRTCDTWRDSSFAFLGCSILRLPPQHQQRHRLLPFRRRSDENTSRTERHQHRLKKRPVFFVSGQMKISKAVHVIIYTHFIDDTWWGRSTCCDETKMLVLHTYAKFCFSHIFSL